MHHNRQFVCDLLLFEHHVAIAHLGLVVGELSGEGRLRVLDIAQLVGQRLGAVTILGGHKIIIIKIYSQSNTVSLKT